MISPTRRTLVLLSLALGVVTGAVAAALAHDGRADSPATSVYLTVARIAAPFKAEPGQLGWHAEPASVAIVARAADPAGGPDWAIRRSLGVYVLPDGVPRSHIGKGLFGDHQFFELGRLHHGTFGWLDGSGTFRSVPAGAGTTPHWSFPAHRRPNGDEQVASTTLITHPPFGEPIPVVSVIWGVVQDRARTVSIDGTSGPVHLGAHGAFLAFTPARGRAPAINGTVTGPDGRQTPLHAHGPIPRRPRPLIDQARLAARTADPSGGAPWGVSAAPQPGGGWCTGNPGRVVDDAVGTIDERLDLFNDQTAFVYTCPPTAEQERRIKPRNRWLSRQRPLSYISIEGSTPGQQRTGDLGQTALRTGPSSLAFAGITRADVRLIKVTTSEQTRLLHPSPGSHAFAVAFGGSLPSGTIRFDVTFTDGTHATQTDHAGI